ncbi:hypothetical protein BT96DRAFT_1016544 [Gymnopus androsaceus JB14]|uniref:Ricin B lectin domain-containing protein n=1 Tax=Gymnopus androsaceus JB14 TaxID=1447944 RepID=A0A6A4I0V9_9AGAR|nr:hypothetical protein BT96DRAFT_929550 [Gymnopus androsaceus JB14]KAE9404165.1 hypothetical protein BT96DRAFT_973353 [Gymnopus androsaceus JB14]KAE9404166.1 hypothetical protein BT96DRAFT_1016544 [Gymnopus androsaceus JB14]
MPTLEAGKYVIVNVSRSTLIALTDSTVGADVQSADAPVDLQSASDTQKWQVVLKSNKHYTFQSVGTINYASVDSSGASVGDSVVGSASACEFIIAEGKTSGQYNISTTDGKLFWNLDNGDAGTNVTLNTNGNDRASFWTFTRVK